ncbi:hypothetical protein ACFLSE_09665 [Bacteroidota bacterium]
MAKKGFSLVCEGGLLPTGFILRASFLFFLPSNEIAKQNDQSEYNYHNEYVEDLVIEEETELEEKPVILDTVPPEMLDDKEDIPYSIEYEDTSEIFKDSIKDTELTEEEESSIIEDFNIQDAVIYSEIINRKEY